MIVFCSVINVDSVLWCELLCLRRDQDTLQDNLASTCHLEADEIGIFPLSFIADTSTPHKSNFQLLKRVQCIVWD